MRAILLLAALLTASAPVAAQTQRLPRTTPTEREVDSLTRSMQRQQRQLGVEQQNQFELNQMRQSYDRQQMFPRPSSPGAIGGGCPPGSIGC